MKKCVMISDSFKGSLSSSDICAIARESVAKFFPGCEVVTLPVADGGEGTVDCFLEACGGEAVKVSGVSGPYGEKIDAVYARLDETTAVVEMAATAGLPMVGDKKDPCRTTTYGVGELVRHAVEQGAKHIILGLGGSATNDGGCGCAAALGVRFTDRDGKEFVPVGGTLDQIAGIDVTAARELLRGVELTAMCDIDNPMYGQRGAAYIFGPQKGADDAMVKFLDDQLRAMDGAIIKCLGLHVADLPGAGAAGAFGAGCVAFLGAKLKSGIETVLDTVEFDRRMAGADVVFTGEGRIDSQSVHGKVIDGISRRTTKAGVPLVAIVGDVRDDAYEAYDIGVTAIFSINRLAIPFSEARPRSRQDYIRTFEDVLRLVKAVEGFRA